MPGAINSYNGKILRQKVSLVTDLAEDVVTADSYAHLLDCRSEGAQSLCNAVLWIQPQTRTWRQSLARFLISKLVLRE